MRPVIYISAAFLLTGSRPAATSASVVATVFSSMATAPPVDIPKPAEFLAQDRDRKCEHVDCYFTVHSDATVSENFCCKRCKIEFDKEPRGAPCHGKKCEKNDLKPVDTPKPAEFLAQDRDRKCEHVDCYFTVHSDPTVSENFCCKKCKSEFDQEPRGVPCHGKKCEKNDFKAKYASAGPKVPFTHEPGSVDAAPSSPTIPTVSTYGLNIADRTNAAGNTASSSSGLKREDEGSPKRDDKDGEDIAKKLRKV